LETIRTSANEHAGHGVLARVAVGHGLDLDRAIEILSRRPGVEFAERNWEVSVEATSDDPAYTRGMLWGMYGDSTTPSNAFGTQAAEAWAAGHTGSSKTVAGVIDTGIDYRHSDLYLNIWLNQGEIPATLKTALKDINGDGLVTFRDLNATVNAPYVSDLNGNARIDAGDLLADTRWENGSDGDSNGYVDDLIGWDFVNNDNDPMDDNRHGTHVGGTIAGQGANGAGVAGVAWDAQLVPLKFLGSGGSGSSSNAVRALDYFTGASLRAGTTADFVATNNSWGGGGFSTAMRDAIDRGANQDILFFAAAGNSSANLDGGSYYPAEYDTTFNGGLDAVVAVASITNTGSLSSFSNYGAQSVDIGAPGSSIYSTVPNGGYATLSGTSMATPHATGAAVLYAGSYPGATGAQIRQAILDGTPTASLQGRTITGDRLDVGKMMSGMAPPAEQPPPLPGQVTLSIVATAANAYEGNSGAKPFSFAVTRFGDTSGAASVAWAVQHGTTGAADFTGALSGTVSFAPGETSKTFSVSVAGDSTVEPDESFSVVLSNPSGAAIGTASGAGWIRNDDSIVTPPPPTDVPAPANQPSALEQYMLERVQATRASVGAQPITWNGDLGEAAQAHTDWMYARGTLSHTGDGGSTPRQRMVAAGFDFSGSSISGENVAMRAGSGRGLNQTNVEALFQQFMNSSGHRANMQRDSFEEIGIGLAGDSNESWVTQNFAGTSARGPFLTGVAFDDRDGDRAYDVGEGLGGVTVTIKNLGTGAVTKTATMAAGGWLSGKAAPGSYEVTFSDGGLAAPVARTATIGTKNVKLDLDVDALGTVGAVGVVDMPNLWQGTAPAPRVDDWLLG
jgi:subtilisin family serine protease/uncharacterized protein YkwD